MVYALLRVSVATCIRKLESVVKLGTGTDKYIGVIVQIDTIAKYIIDNDS